MSFKVGQAKVVARYLRVAHESIEEFDQLPLSLDQEAHFFCAKHFLCWELGQNLSIITNVPLDYFVK